MSDYIKREDVIEKIKERINNPAIIGWLIDIISSFLAAEVAPVVRGKWIHNDEWWEFICTHCHKAIGDTKKYQYCPHCGAKMDLGDW